MKYIHIAGTNGKGSVAEYLSCILLSAWNRCGCYTSPHLVSHTERIRVGNEYISEEELGALLTEVKERGLVANETLFSAYTAAALLWFARKDAAYAVIETGLGGRLDPTNKIAPSLTILTSIDYDHTDTLGSDLKSIAIEKCGIIKSGVPVISPIQRSEVEQVIRETCEDLKAPLYFTAPVKVENRALWGQVFNFEGDDYLIGSIGLVQPEDAALAIKAAKILDIDPGSIKTGIMYTSLRGRTQYIPGKPDMVIDGAHNPASIRMLADTLELYFHNREKVLLFACMKDKDYRSMIGTLKGTFSKTVITQVDQKRGAPAETLHALFNNETACVIQDPLEAWERVKEEAARNNALIVVCGSFYLVGLIASKKDVPE